MQPQANIIPFPARPDTPRTGEEPIRPGDRVRDEAGNQGVAIDVQTADVTFQADGGIRIRASRSRIIPFLSHVEDDRIAGDLL